MTARKKLPHSLREHTGYLITDVARLYRTAIDRKMSRFDLTRSQWWLISFLIYFDGITQQQLADLMDVGKAGVTKLLDRLEEKGMVKRVNDPADARQKRVYLSEHVKPLAAEVDVEITKVAETSLNALTTAEVSVLNKLITQIRHNLLADANVAGGSGADKVGLA
jgi:MarR family transcriptional regulator, transcriptional regulator for hemolysin